MIFRKKDQYHADSDCGKYRVSACRVGKNTLYAAWKNKGGKWVSLGDRMTLEEAKKACEKELS